MNIINSNNDYVHDTSKININMKSSQKHEMYCFWLLFYLEENLCSPEINSFVTFDVIEM